MLARLRLPALGFLLGVPLVAGAYPVVPQPRFHDGSRDTPIDEALVAAKRRNAEPVPFDLKYLPPREEKGNGPHAVVAFRPSAIFDRPGGQRLAKALALDTGALDAVKQMFHLRAVEWPRLDQIDMLLAQLHSDITPAAGEGTQGSFNCGTYGLVIRTRERYDWNGALDRTSPPLKRVKHHDIEYRVAEIANPLRFSVRAFPGEPIKVALFVANDRTLVIDTNGAVKALLDRLADGTPAPTPASWEKVNKGVFAAVVSNTDKQWTQHLPGAEGPRLPKGGDWEWAFLDDVEEIVVGLDDRPTTRFWLRATATNPLVAKRMTWNARRLLSLAEAHFGHREGPEADAIRTLWRNARFTTTLRGFEITADAGTDLLGPILDRHTPARPEPFPMRGPGGLRPGGSGF